MQKISNGFSLIAVVVVTVMLAACVTTTTSALTAREDKSKALETYTQLGLAYISNGNFERAQRSIDKAMEIDPKNSGANSAQALLLQSQGERELAEKQYKAALSYNRDDTRARNFYASFLYSEGRYPEACEQLKIASEDTRYPARSNVFVNLANCRMRTNEPALAIDALEKALTLDRQNEMALQALASLSIEVEKYDDAMRYYERLLSSWKRSNKPQTPEGLWVGIQLSEQFGDLNRKAGYVLQLKNMYPDSEQYQRYKAQLNNE